MRKTVLAFALLLGCCGTMHAQDLSFIRNDDAKAFQWTKRHPKPQIMVSLPVSDLFARFFTLEGQYRFNRNAVILAVGSAIGEYDVSQDDFDEELLGLTGFQIRTNHKYYLAQRSSYQYFSVTHGPSFQQYNMNYETIEFVSFQENGMTLFREAIVEKDYSLSKFNYDARFNYEYIQDLLFIEIGVGFSYRAILSESDKPNSWDTYDMFTGISFEGVRPSLMIKLGVCIDGEKPVNPDYRK